MKESAYIFLACFLFVLSICLGYASAQDEISTDCLKSGVFIYEHEAYECHKK